MSRKTEDINKKVYAIIHKHKNIYDNTKLYESKSGDVHCDFVTEFAQEIIALMHDYGELELIRGFNKAKEQ